MAVTLLICEPPLASWTKLLAFPLVPMCQSLVPSGEVVAGAGGRDRASDVAGRRHEGDRRRRGGDRAGVLLKIAAIDRPLSPSSGSVNVSVVLVAPGMVVHVPSGLPLLTPSSSHCTVGVGEPVAAAVKVILGLAGSPASVMPR